MTLFYLMEIQKGPAWSGTTCTGRRWVFSPEVKSDTETGFQSQTEPRGRGCGLPGV